MKKATFFACACALLMGQSLMAQNNAQEVTWRIPPRAFW